jgi:hypothetical protein
MITLVHELNEVVVEHLHAQLERGSRSRFASTVGS